VRDLLFDAGSDRLWAATGAGVFSTADEGATWQSSSAGLPAGVAVTSLSLNNDTGELFASLFDPVAGGVFRGVNLTGRWTAANLGLMERRVNKVTNDGGHAANANATATTFYAGTSGAGLFFLTIPSGGSGPQIATASLPAAQVGMPYDQTLTAAGGAVPLLWTVSGGALPPGLGLASGGSLVGTPLKAGLYTFTARVVDANSASAQQQLSLLVRGAR
jgi:Putative Ig domain